MGRTSRNRKRSGLTLIELAIVLSVVGLIMGAIWAAGSAVRQRQQIEEGIETVTQIAERVRSLYTAYPGTPNLPTTTAAQIAAGLFPANVIRKDETNTLNNFGGTVEIAFLRNNNWIIGFTVALNADVKVPAETRNAFCKDAATRLQGTGKSTAAFTSSGNVPVPVTPIAPSDLSPDKGPVYVYVKGGGWNNQTGQHLSDILTSVGPTGCLGMAFYFAL